MGAAVDVSRIPAELREELAELLPIALEVSRAVADFTERYERLATQWNTERYPQLAEPGRPDDLDHDLATAAGVIALGYVLTDAAKRQRYADRQIERAMRLLAVVLTDQGGTP